MSQCKLWGSPWHRRERGKGNVFLGTVTGSVQIHAKTRSRQVQTRKKQVWQTIIVRIRGFRGQLNSQWLLRTSRKGREVTERSLKRERTDEVGQSAWESHRYNRSDLIVLWGEKQTKGKNQLYMGSGSRCNKVGKNRRKCGRYAGCTLVQRLTLVTTQKLK